MASVALGTTPVATALPASANAAGENVSLFAELFAHPARPDPQLPAPRSVNDKRSHT